MINDLNAGIFCIKKATQNNIIVASILTIVRDCSLSVCESTNDKYSYNVITEGDDILGFTIDKIEGEPLNYKYVIKVFLENGNRTCHIYKRFGAREELFKEYIVDEDLWKTSSMIGKELFGYTP